MTGQTNNAKQRLRKMVFFSVQLSLNDQWWKFLWAWDKKKWLTSFFINTNIVCSNHDVLRLEIILRIKDLLPTWTWSLQDEDVMIK